RSCGRNGGPAGRGVFPRGGGHHRLAVADRPDQAGRHGADAGGALRVPAPGRRDDGTRGARSAPAPGREGLYRQAAVGARGAPGAANTPAHRDRRGREHAGRARGPRASGEVRPRGSIDRRRSVRAGAGGKLRCAYRRFLDQTDRVRTANMMKGQLAGLMKQAQQMQENLKKVQEEIASMEVEGQAGAGMVRVVMTGRHDVKRVSIDPSLLGEDKDMLEDLVAAAVNDAVRRVEAATQEKMSTVAAGLPLPPGMKLPF